MTNSDIAALMKGIAPALRDIIDATTRPLRERIDVLESDITRMKALGPSRVITKAVGDDDQARLAIEGAPIE